MSDPAEEMIATHHNIQAFEYDIAMAVERSIQESCKHLDITVEQFEKAWADVKGFREWQNRATK